MVCINSICETETNITWMQSDFKVWLWFSISDVSVRELLHLIFDAGSVVYN